LHQRILAGGGCQTPPNALNFTGLARNSQSTPADMLSPENRSRFTTLSKIALGLFWLALFIGTHMPVDTEILPREGRDKLAHFGAYLTLALLVATTWQLAGGYLTSRHLVFAWLALAVYGVLDEVTQIPVGRVCDISDWTADACGAAAGLLVFALVRKMLART
jgi:hypothetical protein